MNFGFQISDCGLNGHGQGRGSASPARACPFRNPQSAIRNGFTLIELMVVIVIILILLSIGLTVGSQVIRSMEESRTREILSNANQIATEYEFGDQLPRVNHLTVVADPFDWKDGNRKVNSPPGATGATGDDYNLRPKGPSNTDTVDDIKYKSIGRFVWATQRNTKLKKMYASFKPEILKDVDPNTADSNKGFLDLLDPWGQKLIYAAYVRDESQLNPQPGNLPEWAVDDFLPFNNDAFFASSGPDKKWGHARAASLPQNSVPSDPYNNLNYLKKLPDDNNSSGTWDPEKTRTRLATEAGDNLYSFDVLNKQ